MKEIFNSKIYVLEVVKFINKSDGPDGWINKGVYYNKNKNILVI